jgi:hypothetical protein
MDAALLHTLYDAFAGDRLAFLYSGSFPDAHTARLIELGEEAVGESAPDRSLRARSAFLVVELYQNIIRHRASLSIDLQDRAGRSLFLLRSNAHGQEVTSMNPIPKRERALLEQQLNALEGMDAEALKERFLDSLQRGSRTMRGGAGLGLIEMARRSGRPLRHRMTGIDRDHLLFTLQVRLEEHLGGPASSDRLLDLLHTATAANGLVLACKGLFNATVIEAVLQLIASEGIPAGPLAHLHTLLTTHPAPAGAPDRRMVVITSMGSASKLEVCMPLDDLRPDAWMHEAQAMRGSDPCNVDVITTDNGSNYGCFSIAL